jgi:hypothetical protein
VKTYELEAWYDDEDPDNPEGEIIFGEGDSYVGSLTRLASVIRTLERDRNVKVIEIRRLA